MGTFVFQPGMTWRKVGYALYSNSLSYREVLEANPAWNVTQVPPPGTVLRGSTGSNASYGASQLPSIYSVQNSAGLGDYSPFSSSEEYHKSLSRYSPSSLRNMERVNGLSSDSRAVLSGSL